jgi:hypothetical protein
MSYFLSVLLGALHGFSAFSMIVVDSYFISSSGLFFFTSTRVLFYVNVIFLVICFTFELFFVRFWVLFNLNVIFLANNAAASAGVAEGAEFSVTFPAVALFDTLLALIETFVVILTFLSFSLSF